MEKVSQTFKISIALVSNYGIIILAFLISYLLRYGNDIPLKNFTPFKETCTLLSFIYILSFIFSGLYKRRFCSHWRLIKNVVFGMTLGMFLAIVFMYIFRLKWSRFPSSIFLISYPIGITLIVSVNIIIYRFFNSIKTRVVVVGGDETEDVFVRRSILEILCVDTIDQILNIRDIDEIFICDTIQDHAQLNLLLHLFSRLDINVNFKPNLYEELLSGNLQDENTLRCLATSLGTKSDHEEFFIRLQDIVLSIGFILFAIVTDGNNCMYYKNDF